MLEILTAYFILNFYLLLSVKCIDSEVQLVKSFTKSPEQASYSLGSTVTLSCNVEFNNRTKIVVFRKDKNMKSEACRAFDPNKYDIICTPSDLPTQELKFTIKKISWEDRGKWECFYSQNIKSIDIEIKVYPLFDQLQVNVVPPVLRSTEPLEQGISPSYRLVGRGSRTNPFNLRDGTTINITCLSSCSYPETTHKWRYKNSTHDAFVMTKTNQKRRDLCNSDINKGMVASQSEVLVNCSGLKMVGANIVMCSSSNESEMKNASVYILCPGGEQPWELTTGEIVGVAVSVAIFILLVVFICLLVKSSRYTSVLGDASTNTYSSGVKV